MVFDCVSAASLPEADVGGLDQSLLLLDFMYMYHLLVTSIAYFIYVPMASTGKQIELNIFGGSKGIEKKDNNKFV